MGRLVYALILLVAVAIATDSTYELWRSQQAREADILACAALLHEARDRVQPVRSWR